MITKLFHMFKDAILKVATLLENFVTSYPELAIAVGAIVGVWAIVTAVSKVIRKRKELKEERALKDLLYRYFTGKHVTTVTFNSTEEVVV